jgi:ribosomal 30S subunit maturation factor RimM
MGKEVQSQRRQIGKDVVGSCLMRVAREEGEFFWVELVGVGVLWMFGMLIGGGIGLAATALVMAGLVNGEGTETS